MKHIQCILINLVFLTFKLSAQEDLSIFPAATAEDLKAFPQSGLITISVKDQPLPAVLEDISKQAGIKVEPDMFYKKKTVSVSATKAPLLQVLGELSVQLGGNIEKFSTSDGEILQLTDKPAMKAFQVHGPLMFAWYGLTTTTEYNFDDPQKPLQNTKYRAGLVKDPRSHVDTTLSKAVRDRPLTVTMDGKDLILESDHKKNQFTSGAPDWEFSPKSELIGKTGDIRVTIPVTSPTAIQKAVLPYKEGAAMEVGKVKLTMESLKTEKAQDYIHDMKSKEFGKRFDVFVFCPTFKLMSPPSVPMQMGMAPGASSEEERKTQDAISEGVLAAHEATLIGMDGTRVSGEMRSAEGISSPWHGYPFKANFKTKDPNFKPKELEVIWAEKAKTFHLPLKIEKAVWDAPKEGQ